MEDKATYKASGPLSETINRPSGTRFVIQNLIELTIDVVDGQLVIQAEAPEGVSVKDHEFDGYTSIDIAQLRYSYTVSHPDRKEAHYEANYQSDLLGKLMVELDDNPEATITIKTSVSK